MTAKNVDLSHIPYMPLQIARLRRSRTWLQCRRRPELAFYLMNLWMRAWHEVPAGSIEADDDVLADAAMCAPEDWPKIKADLLKSWKLVDGRYYHDVVTELATEAVSKMDKARNRTEAARAAAAERQARGSNKPVTGSVTEPVTDSVTGAKVEEEVEGEEKEEQQPRAQEALAKAKNGRREELDELEAKLRSAAGLENDPAPKLMVLAPIIGLLEAGADLDGDILPVLRAKARGGKKGSSWAFYVGAINDAVQARRATGALPIAPKQSSGPTADQWETVVARHAEQPAKWAYRTFGPAPGEPGCRAPPEILTAHGYGPAPTHATEAKAHVR